MAVEVCSARISFSLDLINQTEEINNQNQRLDSTLLDSGSDFNFCIGNAFSPNLSSADELFSGGKLLPIQIKKPFTAAVPKQPPQSNPVIPSPSPKITPQNTEKKRLKEFLSDSADDDKPTPSKSFWQFKRSSSLNCESTRSKSLIRSLQFLSRSNSTGSALNPKPTPVLKELTKPNQQKQPSLSRKTSVSSSSSAYHPYSNSTQKHPLKYGNGVRVSPVLNLPQPFISNATVSFFGFGSIFCSGKVKKKKR